jgi:hypothetical protein
MPDPQSPPGSQPSNSPQPSLPEKLAQAAKNKAREVPAHITSEVNRVLGDVRHATKGELDKISLDSQVWLAKRAKALATGDSTIGIPIPVPSVPNLTIMINFKDLSDVAKGKPKDFMLMYEVYRW